MGFSEMDVVRDDGIVASDRARRIKASAVFCAVALAVLYVASYAVLSRAGFRRANANNLEGFYFCEPTSSDREKLNRALIDLYGPLLLLDRWCGTGRPPANSPLKTISRD